MHMVCRILSLNIIGLMFLITYYIATFFIFSELLAYCIFTCEIQHARSSDLLQILLCVCMLKARQTLTVHAVLDKVVDLCFKSLLCDK